MYIIKMTNDKTLMTVESTPIYQGEVNSNIVDFILPLQYEDYYLSETNIHLEYILPNGISGYDDLIIDTSSYDNFLLCRYQIPTEMTKQSGQVKFWLSITNTANFILKSSISYFDIIPTTNIH